MKIFCNIINNISILSLKVVQKCFLLYSVVMFFICVLQFTFSSSGTVMVNETFLDRKYEIKIKVSFYSLFMNIKKLFQEKGKSIEVEPIKKNHIILFYCFR